MVIVLSSKKNPKFPYKGQFCKRKQWLNTIAKKKEEPPSLKNMANEQVIMGRQTKKT